MPFLQNGFGASIRNMPPAKILKDTLKRKKLEDIDKSKEEIKETIGICIAIFHHNSIKSNLMFLHSTY